MPRKQKAVRRRAPAIADLELRRLLIGPRKPPIRKEQSSQ
jgi:hypothetical protein